LVAALATLGFALTAVADDDDDGDRSFKARLSGFDEVHFSAGPPATLRGAVSTKARGTFRATLDRRSDVIHYKLSYEGLEGTVTQAHIHFGQHHTVGGITVWLCQTPGTPAPAAVAALTPQCVQEGTVSGTITPGQVLAAAGQGLDAGEFNELLRAMRAGATYANVHTTQFPPGEIRGQIRDDD
jgi:hypothetical protein